MRSKVEFNGERLTRCPRRPLLDDPTLWGEVFWLYQNYSNGILPEGSALNSNPHKLVQALRVITDAKNAAQSEREDRERRKQRLADMKRTAG